MKNLSSSIPQLKRKRLLYFLRIRLLLLKEQIAELGFSFKAYLKFPLFFFCDLLLFLHYFLIPPQIYSRRFLEAKGEEDLYSYGFTPLKSFTNVLDELELSPEDHFLDLGCGSGRLAFWTRLYVGCKTSGIDQVPTFIHKARKTSYRSSVGVHFSVQDMFECDYSLYSAVYLYATKLSSQELSLLSVLFLSLKKGSKILSISAPLAQGSSKDYELEKVFPVKLPWGNAQAYLHRRL